MQTGSPMLAGSVTVGSMSRSMASVESQNGSGDLTNSGSLTTRTTSILKLLMLNYPGL